MRHVAARGPFASLVRRVREAEGSDYWLRGSITGLIATLVAVCLPVWPGTTVLTAGGSGAAVLVPRERFEHDAAEYCRTR